MGYSETQNLLFAVKSAGIGSGNLGIVSIASDGTVSDPVVPTPATGGDPLWPSGTGFQTGDVNGDIMYVSNGAQGTLYIIDLSTANYEFTTVGITPSAAGITPDFAFWGGYLWGGDRQQGELARIDPADGTRTDYIVSGAGLPTGIAIGGAWVNDAGELKLYRNCGSLASGTCDGTSQGEIFKIDLSGGAPYSSALVATGPASSSNDAASCAAPEASKIELVKTADPTSLPAGGGNVTYTYTITNLSAVSVTLTSLVDDKLNDLEGQGTCSLAGPVTLAPAGDPNDSYQCMVSTTITVETTNVATACGVDAASNETCDEDQATVTVAAAGLPFQCTGESYIIQGDATKATDLSRVLDTGTAFTFEKLNSGVYATRINNLGYNTIDDFLYANKWTNGLPANGQLIKIDATGAVFPITHSFTLPDNLNSGDVTVRSDGTNIMYLSTGGGGAGDKKLYVVDLSGPTLLGSYPIINPATGSAHPNGHNANDLAVNPGNGYLYGCDQVGILTGTAYAAQLAIIDPTPSGGNVTRTDVNFTDTGDGLPPGAGPSVPPAYAYGAAMFNPAGNLLCYENGGTIYEIDLRLGAGGPTDADPTVVRVSNGTASVDNDGAACVTFDPAPAIDLVKDGALNLGEDGSLNVGDLIDYTFTVTNTGSVTLTNVSVTDPIVSPIDCSPEGNPIADLAPQESVQCTGSYAITQADIDAGQRNNTATATGQDPDGNPVSDQDDHIEPLLAVTVSKTAETSFDRTYNWSIDKTANWSELTLMPGQHVQVQYQVAVGATPSDGNHAVSGDIIIQNATAVDASIKSVTDVISVGIPATVDCQVTYPYTLNTMGTLTCTYGAGLPDGTARTNTATVTTSGLVLGGTATAPVDFANATLTEIDECINVSDDKGTGSGMDLGETCAAKDFTYALDIGPFYCGDDRLFKNTASFLTNDRHETASDDWTIAITVDCDGGCSLTPGYWKTHSQQGPAPYDDNWANLGESEEGTLFFASGQTYYDVLWTEPQGDAYYILAQAYIAAQLNFLNGADPTDAQAAFDAATVLFTQYAPGEVSGAKGRNGKALRDQFITLATTLDNYNNGLIGPGHCSEEEVYVVQGVGGSSMHVGDLEASASLARRDRWNANVTITVHDESDGALADATVSVLWSDGSSGSCFTNNSGQCAIDRNNIRSGDSITFTVTDVAHGAFTYSAADNHDADGDSDGTSITVWKP
jgi:hypothetical protein